MSFYRVGNHGVIFGPVARAGEFVEAPTLTPRPLNLRLAVTGHSIPDNVFTDPWESVVENAGLTPFQSTQTGPYATAAWRWDNDPAAPDSVRALLTAGGADYDMFLGTEAHGGGYDGYVDLNSVAAHIQYSDAYGYATLWHNLAASAGAQYSFYSNFWRNDPTETFGASWRAAQNVEAPLWDGIIDYVNANKAPGTPTMHLVPWLQVFMAVYDAIEAGTITGLAMADIFTDDVHPETPVGQWLMMATMVATMYHRHPDELSHTIDLGGGFNVTIDSGLAAQLRPVVWAACLATPRTGLSA